MTEDKPIIHPANVYYMLCYALRSLKPQAEEQKMAGESFENLHDLFAALLVMELNRLRKQGLYREYVSCADELPTLRGKVDMQGTIRLRMARRQLMACEYDELSADNTFNRILRTTALLLIRHPEVPPQRRVALKRHLPMLDGVGTVEPRQILWSRLCYRRENRHYRLLMELCRFILEDWLVTPEKGEHRLASFLDEKRMNMLFERFLLNFFMRECPWAQASSPRIPWAVEEGGNKTQLPRMQSDIALSCGNQTLIIDAKLYSDSMQVFHDANKLHNPHLYQLHTYVIHYAAMHPQQEVSGLLLYGKTPAAIQPDMDCRMLDKHRIRAATVDMGSDFKSIAQHLKAIAEDLR